MSHGHDNPTNPTQLDRIEAKLDQLLAAKSAARPASFGGVAPASDLDGEWGNPEVRKDPPRWDGPSFAGRKYSECPADFLESLAGFLDWAAGKDEETGDAQKLKYAGYKRKDAARARGWAARVLAGHGQARGAQIDLGAALREQAPLPTDEELDSELPF